MGRTTQKKYAAHSQKSLNSIKRANSAERRYVHWISSDGQGKPRQSPSTVSASAPQRWPGRGVPARTTKPSDAKVSNLNIIFVAGALKPHPWYSLPVTGPVSSEPRPPSRELIESGLKALAGTITYVNDVVAENTHLGRFGSECCPPRRSSARQVHDDGNGNV